MVLLSVSRPRSVYWIIETIVAYVVGNNPCASSEVPPFPPRGTHNCCCYARQTISRPPCFPCVLIAIQVTLYRIFGTFHKRESCFPTLWRKSKHTLCPNWRYICEKRELTSLHGIQKSKSGRTCPMRINVKFDGRPRPGKNRYSKYSGRSIICMWIQWNCILKWTSTL